MKLKRGNGKIIEVEDSSLAKGGEGSIHKIISPSYNDSYIVKIYFEALKSAKVGGNSKKINSIRHRIEYMVQNNPFVNSPNHIKEAFVWPEDSLFDVSGNFVGLLMPFAKNTISLKRAILDRKLIVPWDKFLISHSDSYNIRLKVCYNIAQALTEMHNTNKFIMVDFKPDNMLLLDNGFVRLIDMDSIQISNNGKVIYNATAHTPEYCPPELHTNKVNFAKNYIEKSWDCFSFATLAYEILLNVHPFQGISHNTNKNLTSFDDFITNGYFANGKKKNELGLAAPHNNFSILLGKDLQNLFIRCFDDGHSNPSKRPQIIEWRDALMQEIKHKQNKRISGSINQPKPSSRPQKTKTYPNNVQTPIYSPPPRPILPVSVINTFTIRPAGTNLARIDWSTTNASSVTLNNLNVPVNGYKLVPVDNTSYILNSYDANGNSVSRTLATGINLKINQFNYNIVDGAVDFSWDTTGASRVSINNQMVSSCGHQRFPLAVGNQLLQAEDANGFIVTSLINIASVVRIESFTSVLNRNSAFIEWRVINAVGININGHKVNSNGKIQIPLKSDNYQLTAQDNYGAYTSKSLSVSISPTIKRFEILHYSHSAEVCWDVWYATNCKLNGELVPETGQIKVPLYAKEYVLEVEGGNSNVVILTRKVNAPDSIELIINDPKLNTNISLAEVQGLRKIRKLIHANKNGINVSINLRHATLNGLQTIIENNNVIINMQNNNNLNV